MSRKYFFFDIDGTLTDENPGGKVLESTYRTLDKLREKGHFVAIATGRAEWMAQDIAKEAGIDNIVSDGGNGLTLNGELLNIEPLDFIKANKVIEESRMHHIPYAVSLGNEPQLFTNCLAMKDKKLHVPVIYDENLDFAHVQDIYKIFLLIDSGEEYKIPTLKELEHMRYVGNQLIVEPTHKYQGIIKMVKLLNGSLDDIVVFGDGMNDISMMEQAPISIAMGNAIDEVKEIATFITKDNDDDGIEYACRHFKWID